METQLMPSIATALNANAFTERPSSGLHSSTRPCMQEGHSEHSKPYKISLSLWPLILMLDSDEGRKWSWSFAPTAHIFYGKHVMDFDNNIPKAGPKNSSKQLLHAPKEETDRTMGKSKQHKDDRK
ncbi:uncharacterized protein MEPE_03538 [Melanopsichium pennsylvanicum]|uniref:Uncharacterized protein n=1 Tax=Melanopsichium pennsylvanicum TaxID=63383 RepID=A0AAJ4XM07_9BASI|nr:uncharacterized protein MEPE_03538 [Melanopsichium pennsylvanicum]